jgi:hypothetical protein
MKLWLAGTVAALGVGTLFPGATAKRAAAGSAEPVWIRSFDEAAATARREAKPIFLVFR